MTLDAIIAVVRARAEIHPELRAPLTWDGMRRILAREDVGLFFLPSPHPAELVNVDGVWSIIISKRPTVAPPRRHLYYATHELGHLWLHHDRTCERWETVYNMGYDIGPDPREDEAELFCTLVLGEYRYF